MINKRKLKEYTLYAVGEILLIVIGIFIALQLNNWNEYRKIRIEEETILEEIGENIESSIEVLNSTKYSIAYRQEKIQLLIHHVKFDKPYHDSLDVYFYNVHAFDTPQFSSSGYENLKSRGIGIITNKRLRNRIIETFDQTLSQVVENFVYDGRMRHEEYHNSFYIKSFMILSADHEDNISYTDPTLGTSGVAKPINYDQLIHDASYESLLRSLYDNNLWFSYYAEENVEYLGDLLSEVNMELNNIK